MELTAATGEDVPAVADLWEALAAEQRDHGSHLLAAENHQQAQELIAQYVHTGGVAVARQHGRRVGFVMFHVETGLYETDTKRGVVDNLYVVPGARDDGVGSALLDHAEAELRERGAGVLAVEALWDNEGARRLYERRGYDRHRVTFERPAESDTHTKDPD
ncbi:GNAT family N-acetyltransferase [Halobacterium wangiae]|uniref:GNAT family N-acetyltransferase n=1 Tax=Halobacterium wangiae TaxID=2902623 RepID=UPI001E4AAAB1|nr:GNAT family N-acetyltransferase [Halobacterium wangiae]